ncbi:spermatogenesis-associated protein 7 homolog isoform X2 [Lineus longissimus]|uniref:spermatogenesis-associated protein 7 homolog isoform X2 n=1 Tax=Lineus longissimus TaxID=88925 RepID=UPI00315D191C
MKGGGANPYPDLKGHLGVRSSPLSPTASKLTSQYIVMDHLNAHYRMINNAKPAIDNKAPKAWTSSTKTRDRIRRNDAKKNGGVPSRSAQNSRPNSRMSITSRRSIADQIEAYEAYFNDEPEIGAIVKSTIPQQHSQPGQDIYIERANTEDMRFVDQMVSDSYNNPNTYRSPRPMRSMIPDTMKAGSGNPNVATPRKCVAGDLLDDHSHKFKEGKPFTPRTLNTKNVKSKLSQFKYYNAPKKRSASSKGGSKGIQEEKFEKMETMNTMATTQDLTFEPLRSKDFNQLSSHREKSANIPRLDISVDQDHMVWLNEQAKKAQVRVGSTRQDEVKAERATVNHSANLNHTGGLNDTAGLDRTGGLRTSDLRTSGTLRSTGTYRSGTRANEVVTASDALTREEELKYLEFVSDITSDVLERGIFTNRVLKQVFGHHLEEKKHELKISRMRALLDKLREDLGIPESDGEGEEDFGLKSNVKMSDEIYHASTEPPKPQPRAQARHVQPQVETRHKFVRAKDEVDYRSPGGMNGDTGLTNKHAEETISRKMEQVNFSQPPCVTMSPDHGPHPPPKNGILSDAIDEEESVQESEQNSMMSEQEGSLTSNMDEMSTNRSLPQEHKWMKNASNFTMTLKPGQLDMTLVKPKPRSRDHKRLAETVPANPRARRRELAHHIEEKPDDLGTTGEMSTLTDVTAFGESEHNREDKFDVASVKSDATLKNEPLKGSVCGSTPGSPRGSAHGSVKSHRSNREASENGSVKGNRLASPRGSIKLGSTTSVKASNHAHDGLASEQGSSGTLQGSLEGSTTFITADTMHSALQESPRSSPRARAQPSPRESLNGPHNASVRTAEGRSDSYAAEHTAVASVKGSQASIRTFIEAEVENDSVFSDNSAALESEPEETPKGQKTVPSYSKKTANYDGDDDDDF